VGAAYDTEAEKKALFSVTQALTDTAGSVTATAGYKHIDMALTGSADPIAIVLTETGVIANAVLVITNVHTNTLTFADTAGVQELTGGAATVEQYESIVFRYMGDRWVEISRATNAMSFSTINIEGVLTGGILVTPDVDGLTLSGSQLYGGIIFATAGQTIVIPDVDAAAGTGLSFCVYAPAASDIVIDGNAEDKIRLAGVLGAADGNITNATGSSTGDFACLVLTDFATDVAHWTVMGNSGTWTVPE